MVRQPSRVTTVTGLPMSHKDSISSDFQCGCVIPYESTLSTLKGRMCSFPPSNVTLPGFEYLKVQSVKYGQNLRNLQIHEQINW